jgi:hypothetical protein
VSDEEDIQVTKFSSSILSHGSLLDFASRVKIISPSGQEFFTKVIKFTSNIGNFYKNILITSRSYFVVYLL